MRNWFFVQPLKKMVQRRIRFNKSLETNKRKMETNLRKKTKSKFIFFTTFFVRFKMSEKTTLWPPWKK